MTVVAAGKFGMPFHGKITSTGVERTLLLPNGETRPYPHAIASAYTPIRLQAPDAPQAPGTTPAESAQGMEWRNFVLYQYHQTDLYHQNSITDGSGAEEIIGEWFYMPMFGKRFTIRLTGPGPNHVALSRTYTIGVVGGAELHSFTLVARSLKLSDICDGDGSRALVMLTKAEQAGTWDEVREWVLSYDAETGEIGLEETVLASGVHTETSSSSTSTIPRKALRVVITSTWIENHDGVDYTLHTYAGETYMTAGNETYTSGANTFNHLNGIASGSFRHLLAAMYVDGEAAVITHEAAWSRAQTWTFDLTYTYQSHDEWSEAQHQVINVVDTPGAVHDTVSYSATNALTSSINVNGTPAIQLVSNGSLSGSYSQDGTGYYPNNENPLRATRWTYQLDLQTGLMVNVGRPGVLTDTLNSNSLTGQTMYPDSSIARSIEVNPALVRTLHPVIRDLVTNQVLSPGGVQSLSGSFINYNPATGEAEASATNLSWV